MVDKGNEVGLCTLNLFRTGLAFAFLKLEMKLLVTYKYVSGNISWSSLISDGQYATLIVFSS